MKTLSTTSPANTNTTTKQSAPAKKSVSTGVAKATAKKQTISSPYELQKRVMKFASDSRTFCEKLPKQLAMSEDARQLIRASGELGMHCLDAEEAPSKKAFTLNMKLCRKHVKESLYWLQLLDRNLAGFTERRRVELYNEAHDLRRIFTAICKTAAKNDA